LDRQDQLPEELLEHVEECLECKVDVMEGLEIVNSLNSFLNEVYPFLLEQERQLLNKALLQIAMNNSKLK